MPKREAAILVDEEMPHTAAVLMSQKCLTPRRLLDRLEAEGPQPVYDRLVLELGDPRG